jgi:hypothetical protein
MALFKNFVAETREFSNKPEFVHIKVYFILDSTKSLYTVGLLTNRCKKEGVAF